MAELMMARASSMTYSNFFSPTSSIFTLPCCSWTSNLSKALKTFCWKSKRQYLSSPQSLRFWSSSGSALRQMIKSGSMSPWSGALHHAQSKPLAQEYATPEYQYLSQMTQLPSLRSCWILGMLSHLLAEKSRWIVWSLWWELFLRQLLIICPMGVVRSGKLMLEVSSLSVWRWSAMNLETEDLPERSSPSSTISFPFFFPSINGLIMQYERDRLRTDLQSRSIMILLSSERSLAYKLISPAAS